MVSRNNVRAELLPLERQVCRTWVESMPVIYVPERCIVITSISDGFERISDAALAMDYALTSLANKLIDSGAAIQKLKSAYLTKWTFIHKHPLYKFGSGSGGNARDRRRRRRAQERFEKSSLAWAREFQNRTKASTVFMGWDLASQQVTL